MPLPYHQYRLDPRFEAGFQIKAAQDLDAKILRLHRELGLIRLELLRRKANRAQERIALKYRPDQPRVPAGNPTGGQWTGEGGGGGGAGSFVEELPVMIADYSFGALIAQFETGSGRRCIYRFNFGTVVVAGPGKFLCSTRVPSSAVTHGCLLNDS